MVYSVLEHLKLHKVMCTQTCMDGVSQCVCHGSVLSVSMLVLPLKKT